MAGNVIVDFDLNGAGAAQIIGSQSLTELIQSGKILTSNTYKTSGWKLEKQKGTKKGNYTVSEEFKALFKTLGSLNQDPYWISVFINASMGKFPKGFSFQNGDIVHKKGQKINRLELKNYIHSPYETMSVCINFFQTYGKLYSENDANLMHLAELEQEERNAKNSLTKKWKDVKNKKMKEAYIKDFIRQCTIGMEDYHRQNLEIIISDGFLNGDLTSDDIHFENGKITAIDNIEYSYGKSEFVLLNAGTHNNRDKKKTSSNAAKKKKEEMLAKKSLLHTWGVLVEQSFEMQNVSNASAVPGISVVSVDGENRVNADNGSMDYFSFTSADPSQSFATTTATDATSNAFPIFLNFQPI